MRKNIYIDPETLEEAKKQIAQRGEGESFSAYLKRLIWANAKTPKS